MIITLLYDCSQFWAHKPFKSQWTAWKAICRLDIGSGANNLYIGTVSVFVDFSWGQFQYWKLNLSTWKLLYVWYPWRWYWCILNTNGTVNSSAVYSNHVHVIALPFTLQPLWSTRSCPQLLTLVSKWSTFFQQATWIPGVDLDCNRSNYIWGLLNSILLSDCQPCTSVLSCSLLQCDECPLWHCL